MFKSGKVVRNICESSTLNPRVTSKQSFQLGCWKSATVESTKCIFFCAAVGGARAPRRSHGRREQSRNSGI